MLTGIAMRDVFRTTDGREVPVRDAPRDGRSHGVVVITGDGLPTLVGVGAPELPAETWLSIENRFLAGAVYDAVTRVHAGVLALDPGRDGSRFETGGYGTVGRGVPAAGPLGDIVDGPLPHASEVCAWLVSHGGGRMLAVMPLGMDSDDVRDEMERGVAGDFVVERLMSGSLRADGDIRVRGWNVFREVEDPSPAPGPR